MNSFDREHQRRVAEVQKLIEAIYDEAVKEAAALGVTIDMPSDSEKAFSFDDYPLTQKRVDELLENLRSNLHVAIVNAVNSAWTLANNKNNELCNVVFGANARRLPPDQYKKYYATNDDARQAFLERKTKGLRLSDRVWHYTDLFKREIEMGIDLGIRDGRDAPSMARDLKQYLRHPDKLFRRVRDEHGNLHLSKNAAAFHPGQGVYRSSYMNARRLAATETNMAYRTADQKRWEKMDMVVGQEVHLSSNHTCLGADGKPHKFTDICDKLKGKYPKDFKFVGWHPHCRCYATSILKTKEERRKDVRKILRGEPIDNESENRVDDVPKGFKDWLEENQERIVNASERGTLPYFLRDNGEVTDDGEFVLRPMGMRATPPAPTPTPDTPQPPSQPQTPAEPPTPEPLTDEGIEKMAKEHVDGNAIDVPSEPMLMNGEVMATYRHNENGNLWLDARCPRIEQQMKAVSEQAPTPPNTSRGGNAEYVRAYNEYHKRYVAAIEQGIAEYTKLIEGGNMGDGLKALLANKIITLRRFIADSEDVREWIVKRFTPKATPQPTQKPSEDNAPKFRKCKSVEEYGELLMQIPYMERVDLSSCTLKQAERLVKRMFELSETFPTRTEAGGLQFETWVESAKGEGNRGHLGEFDRFGKQKLGVASNAQVIIDRNMAKQKNAMLKREKANIAQMEANIKATEQQIEDNIWMGEDDPWIVQRKEVLARMREYHKQLVDGLEEKKKGFMPNETMETTAKTLEDVLNHEFGHFINDNIRRNWELYPKEVHEAIIKIEKAYGYEEEKPNRIWEHDKNLFDSVAFEEGRKISFYASTEGCEYFAEAFAYYCQHGTSLNPLLDDLFNALKKNK